MKKTKLVAPKRSKKNELSNTTDPNITLVWEFRWRNIYIMWDRYAAKEFSEYMELWFQALQFIDDTYKTPTERKSLFPKKKK